MVAGLNEAYLMDTSLSPPDLRHECRETLVNFALQEMCNQVKDFEDRLKELVTLIEWEPLIHLMAAGFWMHQHQGKNEPDQVGKLSRSTG
jgi:hypothetical protein